jgi:hypothetical protein
VELHNLNIIIRNNGVYVYKKTRRTAEVSTDSVAGMDLQTQSLTMTTMRTTDKEQGFYLTQYCLYVHSYSEFIDHEVVRIWKEAVVAYYRYYPRRTEENAEKY